MAYVAADDPRRSIVANIIMDRNGCGIAINWAYWLTDRILGALDDIHIRDGRTQITFDDETGDD